ncbi:hypothetical protein [Alteromonas antoniana]|uniref:hypothetical protein n=1 Tax=Alteromonas antoniana TaxID=2803813 RepID=UPI001C4826CE|nr:hypothetical protein [Alteromonas antoniana]
MFKYIKAYMKARAEGSMLGDKARENALDVLYTHGLKAHLYLPSIGKRDNRELCEAMDLLSAAGYLITDRDNQLVGKIAQARMTSSEVAEERRKTFKLVDTDQNQ